MECAECISTGQLCFDCQLRAAREEGRREGYAQATLEMACAPLARGPRQRLPVTAEEAWNKRSGTALQEAVLRAAVEDRLTRPLLQEGVWDWTPDSEQKRLDAAVDALLAAEPAWGEGR